MAHSLSSPTNRHGAAIASHDLPASNGQRIDEDGLHGLAGELDLIVSPRLRHAILIGEFCQGNISLRAAAQAAGLSMPDFLELIPGFQNGNLSSHASPYSSGYDGPKEPPLFSAVLPVYNEEENLPALIARLVPVLESIGTYEIVFVNDGSRDRSVEIILAERARNPNIKLVNLSRNFGHQAALTAGMDHAQGAVLGLMDADLQDPPEELPRFLEAWRNGSDVVYAIREKRKEGIFKRTAYFLFYRILQRVASISIPLDSGDFCLMDRTVADAMLRLPEKGRFLRGLRCWVGYQQTGVRYERAARFAGEPKYTLRKLVKLALDGLLSFTVSPLRLATSLGMIAAGIGILALVVLVIIRLAGMSAPAGWASLAALILFVSGIQLIVLGIQGEYVGRIYEEAKQRPVYVVRELHGAERRDPDQPHLVKTNRMPRNDRESLSQTASVGNI